MPINWKVFLKIVMAILRILTILPPETDVRPIAKELGEAIDLEVNGGTDK